jgi:anionic cell wall polymer biosynthesis LytR-Cps2A-Psr (LCP) family protein
MKNNKPSIDGFIPRRAGSQLGDLHDLKNPDRAVEPIDRSLHTGENTSPILVGVPREDKIIGTKNDITESLREIDDPDVKKKKLSRRQRRKERRKVEPRRKKVFRTIKWVIIALLIVAVLIAGYIFLKVALASNSIFKGSFFDIVQTQPLKMDANGRSNFLLLGTSEDDPGHDAGWLTDTMMLVSIDQKAKNAFLVSVPRDLYVQYDMACPEGYAGRINSYFECVNPGTSASDEQDRQTKEREFVGNIVGMDIQYSAHVNYTVMRDVVNAIGGSITVNIEGDEGQGQQPNVGIMDANFDWKCGAYLSQRIKNCPPDGHFIDYNPGPQVLDAEHALYLAQSRGDAANVGLANSDFDRQLNQQKILLAIKEKALSTGTLTNLGSVTKLIDALGSNLRTNIQTNEIRTLMGLGTDIKPADIQTVNLYKAGEAQFTTEHINGASVVIPAAGEFSYGPLQDYLKKHITSDPVAKEEPHVTVLNGSGISGAAQTEADKLTALNFTVDGTNNAPDGTYPPITIYQINKDKPASAAKLKSLYNVTLLTTAPPVSVVGSTDFLIIIGTASAQ